MIRDDARARFRTIQVRPVRVDAQSLVRTTRSTSRGCPPVTVERAFPDVDLVEWAAEHRSFVHEELRTCGCVLFRGFEVTTAAAFERVAQRLCGDLYTEYGDLPGASPRARVYGSTPYPEDKTILYHNESSHLSSWPKTMCFCCIQPAESGGETPLADCREIHNRMDRDLRDRFERHGLVYIRNFVPGLDVSWRDFFRTSDRSVVEDYCRRSGIEHEWWGDDCLRTKQCRPAIVRHPDTGEKVFFNQILLHHISCLEAEARQTLLAQFQVEQLPRNVQFGDGSPIPDVVVAEVKDLCDEASRVFPWQAGDVLMVDNVRLAHSRNPYRGRRTTLVAMGDMMCCR